MRENGIGVNLHYIPIYKHPYYRRMTKGISDLPEAEKYYKEAISLPIFPKLKVSEQEKVVSTLKAAISK
jgi:dTDP-4-amino-4,6-dideoxygalactose transaminase